MTFQKSEINKNQLTFSYLSSIEILIRIMNIDKNALTLAISISRNPVGVKMNISPLW